MKINIKQLVKDKLTYPTWTTGSVYPLQAEENGDSTLVYYFTKSNRKISRVFPKKISFTHNLSYILGFLKGEGPTSKSAANYQRFTITNSEPEILKMTLKELDKTNLFKTSSLIKNSLHLSHHLKSDEEVINYWSEELDLPKEKFRCFEDKRTSPYGVCHIFISDVLLRRVIDLIHNQFK